MPTTIGLCNREYWANPETRTFAELLIDAEDSREVGAVLVRMLKGSERDS
jgi:hypothetical protein